MIKTSDITARHPSNIVCETDNDYALIANRIYDLLKEDALEIYDDQKKKNNVCINIALYFEDLKSNTHQFEVFTKLYKQMFGLYMPFYASESADSPTAELDAMKFVLWLTFTNEHETILNPLNSDFSRIAKMLLDFWHKEKNDMPVNEYLADYIYSEEVQSDPYEIRNILSWIESKSFLGRWKSNWNLNNESGKFISILEGTTNKEKQFTLDCLAAFANQSWPISMPATHIYAEMIRMEMDDPEDPEAKNIIQMKSEPFNIYRITDVEKNGFYLTDYKDDKFFIHTTKEAIKSPKKNYFYFGGLFSYKGNWYFNGFSQIFASKSNNIQKKYSDIYKEKKTIYDFTHNNGQSYDFALKNMSGKRLLFFKNIKEYIKWGKETMGMSFDNIKEHFNFKESPLMIFLESTGQVNITNSTWFVKHPDSPNYNKEAVIDQSFRLCDTTFFRPELVLYLVQHDLVPDCSFNDILGEEHGRMLFQENIDFIVRCIRRDIESTDVYHKRNKDLFLDEKKFITPVKEGKFTLEEFVKILLNEKKLISKNKREWQQISSNLMVTILKDVKTDKLYYLPTKKLYEAHLALSNNEITIKNLTPYVGKEDASAACAILYNVVGDGLIFNTFRKLDEFFKNFSPR